MREVKTQVYTFDELSDKAKEKALEWVNETFYEHFWGDDSIESIKAFCEQFGVKLESWQYDTCNYSYNTNAENRHFRGVKLSQFTGQEMPTGYCLDCDIYEAFYKTFKETGSALKAFTAALDAGFAGIVADYAGQYDPETMGDFLTVNEYEFTADGKRFRE